MSDLYIPYYKKKIGQYTELMYNANKNGKTMQHNKYKKEREVLREGLAELEKREAVS